MARLTLPLLLVALAFGTPCAALADSAGWQLFASPPTRQLPAVGAVGAVPTQIGFDLGTAAICRNAVRAAEREKGLPPMLLAAIARVESGRRDPSTGTLHPWPWTVNVEGEGRAFASKAEAIAFVRQAKARGAASIDIGCMQVNILHHPDAFPSLEAAFDPLTNARYAARFLTELNQGTGDWSRAAGAYHSRTPELAAAYRERINAAWPDEIRLAAEDSLGGQRGASMRLASSLTPGAPNSLPPPPASLMPGTPLSGPVATQPGAAAGPFNTARSTSTSSLPPGGGITNGAERAQVFAAAEGTRGRGLDAYRGMPIPLASRNGFAFPARTRF